MTSVLLDKNSPPKEEDQFLSEVRRIPRLTQQEELELARLCAQGDTEAVKTMVSANLRLVVSVAREYAGRGVPLLDLIQEGSIGLLAAAQKFDYSLNYRFSTYATKWIRQGITKYLANQADAIRIPAYTAQKVRTLRTASQSLAAALGREPTEAELARETGLPEDRINHYLQAEVETCSLDAPLGNTQDSTMTEVLEDIYAPQPQQELVRRELKQTMEGLLSQLTPRQQQVLRLRFGMTDGICHAHEAIGGLLGISKERSRQLEKQGVARLHKLGAGLGLEDFLE